MPEHAIPNVTQRIALKLALLRKWLAEGVPNGVTCPDSLASARDWDDPELGAFKVGSKRAWNAANSPHRASIIAIADAIKVLNRTSAAQKRQRKQTLKERIEEMKLKAEIAELAREEVSGQWQATSQKLQSASMELRTCKARVLHLEQKLKSANETISRLKRELYIVYES